MVKLKMPPIEPVWQSLESSDQMLVLAFANTIRRVRENDILDFDDPTEEARQTVCAVLDMANEACGSDIIDLAYGTTPEGDVGRLKAIAKRVRLAGSVFGRNNSGEGSLRQVAQEADDISLGDAPKIFAKISSRRKSIRLLRAKVTALRLDSWLQGVGQQPATRHAAISASFNAEWDTISRWASDAREVFGVSLDNTLSKDRQLGERERMPLFIRRAGGWERALEEAASAYRMALKG